MAHSKSIKVKFWGGHGWISFKIYQIRMKVKVVTRLEANKKPKNKEKLVVLTPNWLTETMFSVFGAQFLETILKFRTI